MQQPEVGKCIGLTEVAVYEYVRQETAKETKTLSEIKLDGKLLEGFDPNTNEYTVNVEAAPKTVEASAEDNAAITILPVNNNKSKIIVRSESGERNKYTINYVLQDTGDSADINGDGTVTIKDLSIASKHFGEVIAGNAISEKCDINKDGIVNDADIQIIMDKILE